MAIAFVKEFLQPHSESSSYSTPVPAAGVAQGNHLILSHVCSSSDITISSVVDDKGNTYTVHDTLHDDNATVLTVQVASARIATALVNGDTIDTTFVSGLGGTIHFSEWSGLATSAFDKLSDNQVGFDNVYTSDLTAVTSQANELIYGAHANRHTDIPMTPDAPFIELHNGDNGTECIHVVQYRIVSAAAAYESTGTLSGDTTTLNIVATFKEGGPVGTTPTLPRFERGSLRTSW